MPEAGPLRFAYTAREVRVVFGAGSLDQLPAELDRLGSRRVVVISTPGRAGALTALHDLLGSRLVESFTGAVQHVPRAVVRQALEIVARAQADLCIAIGGGSAIGLGKAVALETGVALAAIPTTYSGSEMTAVWGISEGSEKKTGRDPKVAPKLVLYDPALTLDLSAGTSAASGMNALAHCAEALYAADASPVSSLFAVDGALRLGRALPRIVRDRADLEARGDALIGSHLAGRALDLTSMGLHHKLCHVLGGTFGLPHAETHAALLPHVIAFNATAAPEAMRQLADSLGASDAVAGLLALSRSIGTARTLGSLGLRADDVPRAATLATQSRYPNPRPVLADDVRSLLECALVADAPAR